jgi:hypothetical protein
MFHPRSFAAAALALTLSGMLAQLHADTVLLSNLDQPFLAGSSTPFVGQSFIAGTVDQPLYGAQMQLDPSASPSPDITLELEARNGNGTVGATLFDDFSSMYNAKTGVITFTANSAFELIAGTGYWLVLSDPSAGGVSWDFTSMNNYESQFAYEPAVFNTSWTSTADNGQGDSTYYQLSDGPQVFALIASSPASVPEPSSWLLLCFPVAIAVLTLWFQGARRGRPVEAK